MLRENKRFYVFNRGYHTACQTRDSYPWLLPKLTCLIWGRIHYMGCDSCPILEDWLQRTFDHPPLSLLTPTLLGTITGASLLTLFHFELTALLFQSYQSTLATVSPWNESGFIFSILQTNCNLTVVCLFIIRATQKNGIISILWIFNDT